MTVLGALAGGRRASLMLLVDRCKVSRPLPVSDELDPGTGLPTESAPTVVIADAKCWLDMSARRISASETDYVAGDYVKVQRPAIALGLDQPVLLIGDVIELTVSTASLNVGRKFTVTGLPAGSFTFLASYSVDEVV